MKRLLFIMLCAITVACTQDAEQKPEENKQETEVNNETTATKVDSTLTDVRDDKLELVEVEGNIFKEYYPGKRVIKFQGPQDENGERHGKWLYFAEDGTELSMTMYEHGKKHGHIMVKHPNGAIHYHGEFKNDQPVGIWKTYTSSGEQSNVKDYGYPE